MVGPNRMGNWIDQLRIEHSKKGGEPTVEKAKSMLALCSCIQASVTGFLTLHDLKESCRNKVEGEEGRFS